MSLNLLPYDTTYRFGRISGDIQVQWVDREDWRRRVGVSAGLALVGYQWSARMSYHTKGGGVLCRWQWQWKRRRKKGELVQIVRKCNE